MRQELAQAMAAVASQQERAVAAERAVDDGVARLREAMTGSMTLHELRSRHDDLSIARQRAAHERTGVHHLEGVADERRADLVRASQDREALSQLRRTAQRRHHAEGLRRETIALDELAMRRAGRRRAGAAA